MAHPLFRRKTRHICINIGHLTKVSITFNPVRQDTNKTKVRIRTLSDPGKIRRESLCTSSRVDLIFYHCDIKNGMEDKNHNVWRKETYIPSNELHTKSITLGQRQLHPEPPIHTSVVDSMADRNPIKDETGYYNVCDATNTPLKDEPYNFKMCNMENPLVKDELHNCSVGDNNITLNKD